MSSIHGKYCIDKFEAATVEVLEGEKTRPHPPYAVRGRPQVKAVSKRGVKPQAVHQPRPGRGRLPQRRQAALHRRGVDHRLQGQAPDAFPYGDDHKDGYCNDTGVSSFNHYYGGGNAEPPKERTPGRT